MWLAILASAALASAPPANAPAPEAETPAHAMGHSMDHEMGDMDMSGMEHMDHSGHMDMSSSGHQAMAGLLGDYAFTRDASGTSWQPDASSHEGLHLTQGPWMLMAHAQINGVYDWQQGPRGGQMGFVAGMIMASARRTLGEADRVQFRAMLSPDPFMGKRGYPLLLQTGETADGKTPLRDRQHPHDLFMELSAEETHRLGAHDSLFVYAGLPGEPAFGPPAFPHRMSAMDDPLAPLSHHWLDSTHVTFGVATLGWVHDNWKLEASAFKGREPDQHRFDIEGPRLDSAAARLSWNPTSQWSMQLSWADQAAPEQLHPVGREQRWSASAIYTHPLGGEAWWSTTLALGLKRASGGPSLAAGLVETALHPNRDWSLFARVEALRSDDLSPSGTYTVGNASVGAVRDVAVGRHWALGLGAVYSLNAVPGGLKASYGGQYPEGAAAFVRLKLR
jgi:hypothetical protein